MKILAKEREILRVGEAKKEKEFGVKITPHLMSLLSNIYEDPHWACVREPGTNMLDAYVKMPKDRELIVPRIHVPNHIEPWLAFTDFGVGMDWDTVWNVFTTYGDSLKQDNNLEVGGFGIGSKAPFAYTDQWTVESRWNGERMIFTAFKDETAKASFQHLDTVETDEPNGVTVKIPVNLYDITSFHKRIRRLLRYFPMEVEIIGADIDVEEWQKETTIEYMFESEHDPERGFEWGIAKQREDSGYVIMGNVPYSINWAKVGISHQLPTSRLDVYLPVGAVDIAPSRETLIYSERTIARLRKVADVVKNEVTKKVTSYVDAAKNAGDYITRYSFLSNEYGSSYIKNVQPVYKDARWGDLEINQYGNKLRLSIEKLKELFPSIERVEIFENGSRTLKVSSTTLDNKDSLYLPPMDELEDDKLDDADDTAEPFPEFVVKDLGKGHIQRIKHAIHTEIYEPNRYGRSKTNGRRSVTLIVPKDTNDIGFKLSDLQDALFGHHVVLASTLEKPEKVASVTKEEIFRGVKVWRDWDVKWVDLPTDFKEEDVEEAYFVRLNRKTLLDFPDDTSYFDQLVGALKQAGILTTKVYGVQRGASALEDEWDWSPLKDLEKKARHLIGVNKANILDYRNRNHKKQLQNEYRELTTAFKFIDLTGLDSGNVLVKLNKELGDVNNKTTTYDVTYINGLSQIAYLLKVDLGTPPTEEDTVSAILEEVNEKYPIFEPTKEYLNRYSWNNADDKKAVAKDFIRYVTLREKENECDSDG